MYQEYRMNKNDILEQRNKIIKSNDKVNTYIYQLSCSNNGYVEISMNINDITRPVLKRTSNSQYLFSNIIKPDVTSDIHSNNIGDILWTYYRK